MDQPDSSSNDSSAPSSAGLLLPGYLFMFAVVALVDRLVVATQAESW